MRSGIPIRQTTNVNQNHNAQNTNDSFSNPNNKVKAKRTLVNAFKRLSLKRGKSDNRSNNSKSDSDISVKHESPRLEKVLTSARHQQLEDENAYVDLSMWSDPSIPYQSISNSVLNIAIEPLNFSKLNSNQLSKPSTSRIDLSAERNKTNNLYFNPSDLPSLSQSEIIDETFTQPPITNRNVPNYFVKDLHGNNEHEKYLHGCGNYPNRDKKYNKLKQIAYTMIPTTFIPETNNTLNLSLSLGLKEVLDLIVFLQESETNIKHIISKYICNGSLEKELIHIVSSHAKIQIENERRSYKLAHEIFTQEIEVLKAREKTLQDSLDVTVYLNRLLEDEAEVLKAENEKVFIDYENFGHYDCCKKNIEELTKNNNEIRTKYKNLLTEIKKLENELVTMQNQNQCLINQLANSNCQIRNYRSMLHRAIGDHELEQVTLSHQLAINEQLIKDCVDAGETLLEDLETIKKQLSHLPSTINWTKFKSRGSSIVDLLHLSRNCLNELTRELININNQIRFRNKDSETQNVEINKLTEELSKVKSNDEELQTKLDTLSTYEHKIELQTQKIDILKQEFEMVRSENSLLAEGLHKEKCTVNNLERTIEDLNIQLNGKDIVISNLNTNVCEFQAENRTLKFQVDSMQKLLDEHKLSNVLQELMEIQAKCTYYEGQFYQLDLEKKSIALQSQKFDNEKENLVSYHKSIYEHIQKQQEDIEELSKQNDDLKSQLLSERENIIEKNAALAQQIEETNIMKTLQSQFNVEYSKNLNLEATAIQSNYELNRLSVVAEYNNEISKQLKGLITAKDETISDLKSNLEKLNQQEKQNIEEKASLCNELTQASCIIEQLQKELENEKRNVQKIIDEKQQLENNAEKKIQELHKILMDERQALHQLITDHQSLSTQNNNFVAAQSEQQLMIENLKQSEQVLKASNEKVELKCEQYHDQCLVLSKQLEDVNNMIDLKEMKLRNCSIDYENKLSCRDEAIEKLKRKNEELQNTIQYLQCNTQKLQSDLNDLRNHEKINTEQLQICEESVDKFKRDSEKYKDLLSQCQSDNKILEGRLTEAILQYNSLLKEYNEYIIDSQAMERKLKDNLKIYKELCESKSKNLETLAKASRENFIQLGKKQAEYDKLKAEINKLEFIRDDFNNKSRLLKESLNKQRELDEKLMNEKNKCLLKVNELNNTMCELNTKFENSFKERQQEIEICRNIAEEVKSEWQNQKEEMFQDLIKLGHNLSEITAKYKEKLVKLHDLRLEYKDLADSMTKALNLLLQEKVERANADNKVLILEKEIEELKSKLEFTNNCVEELTDLKTYEIDIAANNEFNRSDLEETKRVLNDAKKHIQTLENQLHETTRKLKKLEEISIIQEKFMFAELQNRTELLNKADKQMAIHEERNEKLKQQIKISNRIIITLKTEISHLNQKIQILEFQKCELTLRYHEVNGKLQIEQNLNTTLKESHHQLLAAACDINSVGSGSTQSVSTTEMLVFKYENKNN